MRLLLAAFAMVAFALVMPASGREYFVSPDGKTNAAGSASDPLKTIGAAIQLAQPGDTVRLLPGLYLEDIVTLRDGTADAPITISGTHKTIVSGAGNIRVVRVQNDYIVLTGFVVDGHFQADTEARSSYRDKLVYVMGKVAGDSVTGFKMSNMLLQNAGSECVRLRYGTTRSEISGNQIRNCGIYDFRFFDGGKNGEGIYVGTAPEQLGKFEAPTADVDHSNQNWVHDNIFDTNGNECVDIKEGSSQNVVENNSCSGQMDSESGGMDSRGSGNIFRYNDIHGNRGVGVRLGGDTASDGVDNEVYGNVIHDNDRGGIRIQRSPQALICANALSSNGGSPMVGTFGSRYAGGDACDMTVATNTLPITGHRTLEATSAVVGARVAETDPDIAAADAAPVALLPRSDADTSAPKGPVTAEVPAPLPATGGISRFRCPTTKASCVVGIYEVGKGLSVLHATQAELNGLTVGFADLPTDTTSNPVNLRSLAGDLLVIEYDGSSAAGLIGPTVLLAVKDHP
jgi:hypothetical protein